jgi:methyl-accepting chemotaxis protein
MIERFGKRYAVKFAASFLLVLLVIAGVGFVGVDAAENEVRESTERQLQDTSELRAESIGEFTERIELQIRTTSEGEPLVEGETAGAQSEYLALEKDQATEDVVAFHVVDESNQEVAASTIEPINETSLERLRELGLPWASADVPSGPGNYTKVWRSDTAYRSPIRAIEESNVIAFASTIPKRDGQYVVAVVRIPQIDRGLDQQTTVINQAGQPVLQPDSNFDTAAHRETIQSVRETPQTAFKSQDRAVHAFASVPGTDGYDSDDRADWVAVTTVDKDTAFEVSQSVRNYVIAIVLAALSTLLIVGYLLWNQTVTPLNALRDRAQRMEDGDLTVDLETDRTDEFGRLYQAFASMRDALRLQIEDAEQAREQAERERERIEEMNETLQQRADEYAAVMQEYAAGDLTSRMTPAEDNEAMAAIAHEFNEMATTIEEVVDRVDRFSTIVSASSQQVTASSQEVRSASEQVSRSVQEISAGADRQYESLETVAEETEQLSTTIQEIASVSEEVATLAERTVRVGQKGRQAAKDAIDGMDEIEEESAEAVEAIRTLETEMEKIGDVIEFISEVAEQTNMLALNANIEASRSSGGDDSGDGFGVVAEEVKELAAETKEAADDIQEHLEQIQKQTETACTEVEQTSARIGQHRGAVERSVESLERIASFARKTNEGVQQISRGTKVQAQSTQQVLDVVNDATSISRETNTEAENVAAAAEEQTSSLNEVTKSAEQLSEEASELSRTVDHFETDVTETQTVEGLDGPESDRFGPGDGPAAQEHD